MSVLRHAKQLRLAKSLYKIVGSALVVSFAFAGTIEATNGPAKTSAIGKSKSAKSIDLSGIWMDKWRDKVHLWQEDGKIVGAYTWYGTPAAIIGLVETDSVTLRYYQAIGHSGEARCFIRKDGARLDCEYLSHDGEEQGDWVMLRVPKEKSL